MRNVSVRANTLGPHLVTPNPSLRHALSLLYLLLCFLVLSRAVHITALSPALLPHPRLSHPLPLLSSAASVTSSSAEPVRVHQAPDDYFHRDQPSEQHPYGWSWFSTTAWRFEVSSAPLTTGSWSDDDWVVAEDAAGDLWVAKPELVLSESTPSTSPVFASAASVQHSLDLQQSAVHSLLPPFCCF